MPRKLILRLLILVPTVLHLSLASQKVAGSAGPPWTNCSIANPAANPRANNDPACGLSYNDPLLPAPSPADRIQWVPVTFVVVYHVEDGNVTGLVPLAKVEEQIRIMNDDFAGRLPLPGHPPSADTRVRFWLRNYVTVQNNDYFWELGFGNEGCAPMPTHTPQEIVCTLASDPTVIPDGPPGDVDRYRSTASNYLIFTGSVPASEGGDTQSAHKLKNGACCDVSIMDWYAVGVNNGIRPTCDNQSICFEYTHGGAFTHEAGHFLGDLIHPHTGSQSCATPGDCSTTGDLICDTPPVTYANGDSRTCLAIAGPHAQCDPGGTPAVDCTGAPPNTWMGKQGDYDWSGASACAHPKIWTNGQAARIRCVLNSVRRDIVYDASGAPRERSGSITAADRPVTLTFTRQVLGTSYVESVEYPQNGTYTVPSDWQGTITASAPGVEFVEASKTLPTQGSLDFVGTLKVLHVVSGGSIAAALAQDPAPGEVVVERSNLAYSEPPLVIPYGTRIVAGPGFGTVHLTINGSGSGPALDLSASDGTFSRLDGLLVESNLATVVRLRAGSQVNNCTVLSTNSTLGTGVLCDLGGGTIENTSISGAATGIRITGSASVTATSTQISNCFDGIYVSGGNGTINSTSISGSSGAGSGIRVTGGIATVTGCVVTGYPNSQCVWLAGGKATLCQNTIGAGSKWGVYLTSGPHDIGLGSGSGNDISGCNSAIYALCTGSGTCPSQSYCPTTFATVRYNNIHDNVYGVQTIKTKGIDLGTAVAPGNNSFSGNSAYCIWNRASTCGTVPAQGNWFGQCAFPACTSGQVDVTNYLCSAPLVQSPRSLDLTLSAHEGPMTLEGVFPNPVTKNAEIRFKLPNGSQFIRVDIFDAGGRMIRSLGSGALGAGLHQFNWDGSSTHGDRVAPGVYFVRISDKHWCLARKLVVAVR